MNILITAPSLSESENVSGISTIVKTIIANNETINKFFHFRIGNKDGQGKGVKWVLDQLLLLPRLVRFIKQHDIEAIHLNTAFTKASLLREFAILWFLKSVLQQPILLHIHGGYMLMAPPKRKSIYGRMIAYILKYSDVNLVLSKVEQQQLEYSFGARSQVLPNAVPPLPKKIDRKKFDDKIRFIFLGRIVKSKGVYLIVEALKELINYHNDFSFTLYGAGPEVEEVLEKLKAINKLDFTYKGVAKNDEKWEAFDEANVLLLPSIHGEGLPIAMLEAMQFGCIPVVSDDASITTVVKHSLNGFVVKKGSQDELTITLKKILEERNSLVQISNTAKTTIAESYGISNYIESLASCYCTLNN